MSGSVWSLLPVLLAVGLSIGTRHVVLSLGAGVLCAALLLQGGDPFAALVYAADTLVLDAIADKDHAKVTLFSLCVAATVAVVSRAGGTTALVGLVARVARGRRSAMAAAWISGAIVFFDDYANCLVVGHGMRPLFDRARVSREKLAFITDATAAPVASVAMVGTWVGYEVGLLDEALKAAGRPEDAYALFLEGLPYRFYPWILLALVGAIALLDRDFGPMRAAEARALRGPPPADAETSATAPPGWAALLAVLPIGALLGWTALSLWRQGSASVGAAAPLFRIIGAADGYQAMLEASVVALALAIGLAVGTRRLGLRAAADGSLHGMAGLFEALVVLVLAWSLAGAIEQLHAADFVVAVLGPHLPAALLPTAIFVAAAALSFATGTSFGTMGVLVPLVIPLTLGVDPALLVPASAAVLSGAIWGDHCSPISDTTVLSATASGCDLHAHVETQLPYAVAGGVLAVVFGTLPSGFGLPAWPCVLLGCVAAVVLVRWRGRPPALSP